MKTSSHLIPCPVPGCESRFNPAYARGATTCMDCARGKRKPPARTDRTTKS